MDVLDRIAREIVQEVLRADDLHQRINSVHEGYAVIAEELDEFWEQVKLKKKERSAKQMAKELIQTAAMCVRTVRDVVGVGNLPESFF